MTHATYFSILIGAAFGLFVLGAVCHQAARRKLGVPDGERGDSLLRAYTQSWGIGSPGAPFKALMLASRTCFLGFVGLLLFAGVAAMESPAKRIEFVEVWTSGTKTYYAVDHWVLRPDIRTEVFPRGASRFVREDEDGVKREISESYANGGVRKATC